MSTATLTADQQLTAGQKCSWCTQPTGPAPVMFDRRAYCTADCVDADLWACGNCGEDRRRPADPAIGASRCPNHARHTTTTDTARDRA